MELKEIEHRNALEVIREELAKIKAANAEGLLIADEVVDAAASETHPLHSQFNWDNDSAGHQYRLMQARGLIRKVRVISPNGNDAIVPKYVSLMSDRNRDRGGYRETSDVLDDEELTAELEETAKKELQAWMDRHAMLTTLCQKVARAAGVPVPKKRSRKRGSRR